ncbi:molybdopterin molybdenumtransferase MoeA [Rhodobacteraceae bacterium B1Z28]|uniref:Molybdopterin molybdenumtransferase n=1 Tax=Ruegeria haliotis TaxID=2747601 RepID=A0ABX2PUP8_9RHOB|nr:gephyrin-like molybdotransferase Glp [Ruegeria haliotis]NVO57915.1 molybdopterin molybdenumtransferase MoeA [Ruegeria haliotis]
MTVFDTFAMVDWASGNDTGPTPRQDAIWACVVRKASVHESKYLRNRTIAESWLHDLIAEELSAGRRLCLGYDFPFGYPKGFARALTGSDDPLKLWDWFEERIDDEPGANNRFDLAGEINRQFGGKGPFWFNGLKREIPGLAKNKRDYHNPFPERRAVETAPDAKGSFTCWQMGGAGAVGGQIMTGISVLARLRRHFENQVAIWPFERLDKPVAFVEIWPSLNLGAAPEGRIKDAWQVEQVACNLAKMSDEDLCWQLDVSAAEEGWILGVSQDKPNIAPPPLRNDCFALPAGVNWTPVDEALALLQERLRPITASEHVPLMQACGRVLAEDVFAKRSNPPQPNTAVDGYGFAGAVPEGPRILPLVDGRAAAGIPFDGEVPEGRALRVLTGAALPEGVDTVILEEDVTVQDNHVAFHGPLKRGANTRRAGEDVVEGDMALPAGRKVTSADLALLSAVGIADVPVRKPLRVAVLSTGDELVEPGECAGLGQIFDANRPMLLSLIERMGFVPVDMGRVGDDRELLSARLDEAAQKADVILTSGGASAGDEDHVSALLRQSGALQEWRIALKPGRPLALGMWSGAPVFGLPGNPVAAMVCTLIFARPALGLMSGEGWSEPQGFDVPAAFEKRKKPGRREYLRARIRDGRAEVFHSEGSGRISGLSWAEGLVEIEDGQRHVRPGDLVRFIPYGSFGL